MLNEGNIKASILPIILKFIAVDYSNVSESFVNYGPFNTLFHFFRCLIDGIFHKTFVKKFMKKLSFFQLKIQKSISRCSILQKIKMSNFVILPFEYTVKSWKICQFLALFFQVSKMLTFWIFRESTISVMVSYFS